MTENQQGLIYDLTRKHPVKSFLVVWSIGSMAILYAANQIAPPPSEFEKETRQAYTQTMQDMGRTLFAPYGLADTNQDGTLSNTELLIGYANMQPDDLRPHHLTRELIDYHDQWVSSDFTRRTIRMTPQHLFNAIHAYDASKAAELYAGWEAKVANTENCDEDPNCIVAKRLLENIVYDTPDNS